MLAAMGGQDPFRLRHDWQSADFVDWWVRNRVETSDATRLQRRETTLQVLFESLDSVGKPDLRVLDLGAGTGIWSIEILKRYPAAHVTLVDSSQPMLAHAERALAAFPDRHTIICADLQDPAWQQHLQQSTAFDAVVSQSALHHLPNQRVAELYFEIAIHLAPGGVVANFDEVHRPVWRLLDRLGLRGSRRRKRTQLSATKDEHVAFLQAAGFQTTATGDRWCQFIGRKPAS